MVKKVGADSFSTYFEVLVRGDAYSAPEPSKLSQCTVVEDAKGVVHAQVDCQHLQEPVLPLSPPQGNSMGEWVEHICTYGDPPSSKCICWLLSCVGLQVIAARGALRRGELHVLSMGMERIHAILIEAKKSQSVSVE